MAVWTIAAQEGTGGERIAAELAAAAGVPLLDRGTLAVFAHELDPDRFQVDDLDGVEERFAGRLNALALSMGLTAGPAAAAAAQELQLLRKLPDLGRAVLGEAARRPCVIVAPAAFAALQEHPAAIHVRLRAPLEWRIAAYRREYLVDRHCAEKALK